MNTSASTHDAAADRAAILELGNRYTDAVNQRDWTTYRDCWTDDAVWELGAPVNQLKTGIEDIMTEVQRAVGAMDLFVQMNHAGIVLSVTGDTAKARFTLNEIGAIAPSKRELLAGAEGMYILAYYHDDLSRSPDGQWRFARRRYQVVLFDPKAPSGQVFALTK